MKKFDQFINENESNVSRVQKTSGITSFLKSVAGNACVAGIEEGHMEIYGRYNTPAWSNSKGEDVLKEYEKAYKIIKAVNDISNALGGTFETGTGNGSNYSSYTIKIDLNVFDKNIESDLIKSLTTIDKYKL